MIDAEQAAGMRATNALTLVTPAQVWRAEETPDGEGGTIEDWNVVVNTVCSREPATRQQLELVIADRVASVTYWSIELPVGTDVTAKDRIVTENRTFEVVAPVDDSYGLDLVLVCLEVR